MDADWLAEVRERDAWYHRVKLMAWAQWEPQKLHDEHADWRDGLLTGVAPATSRDALEAAALALLRRTSPANAGAH